MTTNNLPRAVAVIGAGTMGNGIAQVFATSGVETHLIDVKPEFLERGVANIHKSLAKFQEKGTLTAEQVAEPRGQDQGLPGRRRRHAPRGDPGQQHVLDLDHGAGG
jgi:pyruvate/2-oxoglutarate dehydrogenase complex dihydrolipoamide dehydrogenase (E3) component